MKSCRKLCSLKIIGIIMATGLFFSCSGKNDEPSLPNHSIPESPFQLKLVESGNAYESSILNYYSPDPGCGIPYHYEILADYRQQTVIVECTNYDNIELDLSKSYIGDAMELNQEEGLWAEVTDNNKLCIQLPELYYTPFDQDTFCSFFLYSNTDKGVVDDYLYLYRSPSAYWAD